MKTCLLLIALSLGALAHEAKAQSISDTAAIRQALHQYMVAWLRNDEQGVLSLFEETARISPNGMCPMDSLHNLRNFWFPKDGSTTTIHAFDQEILSINFDGDLAFTTQKTMLDWTYEMGTTRMGKQQWGVAATVFRRQTDGGWKIWRQQWTDLRSKDRPVPELVAPGVISTENPEFAATTTPDGQQFFFNRTTPDRKRMYLMQSMKSGGEWQPAVFPSLTDTAFNDIDPFVSPDGMRLLFTSNRPLKGKTAKDYDLWFSENKNGKWAKPKPLEGPMNTAEDEIYCSASLSGDLYFARFLGNKAKLFRSVFENGKYLPAEQLNLPGTDTASISNPAISPDGQWLVFASGEMGGKGSADLFVSQHLGNGSWSAPANLARLNSPFAEFAPAFSPDGKVLYFTSERPGVVRDFGEGKRRPGDLYRVAWDGLAPQ